MIALVLCGLLSAAPDTGGRTSVTVLVEGPDADATRRALEKLSLPVELRLSALPASLPAPPPSPWISRLSAARKAWVNAAFDACLAELEPDTALYELLAAQERTLAARLLAWKVACLTGANQTSRASAIAEQLGTLQLTVPDDAASMTPDVEGLLVRANTRGANAPTRALKIDSEPQGATVSVDGRPAVCTTPCSVDLPPGAHVIHLSADGYTPAWRVVTDELPRVTLEQATPELAASQWRLRAQRGESLDGEASVRLLANALRAPRLAVLTADVAAPRTLRGALAVDGALRSRAERTDDVEGLVRDLLVRSKVIEEAPPIYRRWPFWVAVGIAVAGGVTTAVVLATQDVSSTVVFQP